MRRLQTSDTIDRNKAMGTAHRSTSAWVSDHWLAGAATAPWREERFMSDLLSKHLSATVTSVAGQTHAGAFRLATHSQCIRRANEMAGTSTAMTDLPKRRKCRMCGREKNLRRHNPQNRAANPAGAIRPTPPVASDQRWSESPQAPPSGDRPARGYLCPLVGRSPQPSRPRLSACPLRFAIHGFARSHSPLEGTGSPVPSRIESYIGEASGYPYPGSRRIWPAKPWMAQRRQIRVSGSQDG